MEAAEKDDLTLAGIMELHKEAHGDIPADEASPDGIPFLKRLSALTPRLKAFVCRVSLAEGRLSKSRVYGIGQRKLTAVQVVTHELAQARGASLQSGSRLGRQAVWREWENLLVEEKKNSEQDPGIFRL